MNRGPKRIILTFDQDNLKDENRHVGKALQSLCQFFVFGFD